MSNKDFIKNLSIKMQKKIDSITQVEDTDLVCHLREGGDPDLDSRRCWNDIKYTVENSKRNTHSSLRELRLMLAHVCSTSYESIFSRDFDVELNEKQKKQLEQMVLRRCKGEPLAKILNYKEFWGRRFFTNQYTLDPRPDSETMIEAFIKDFPDKNLPLKILELGVGTGCLLFTLLLEYPNAIGVGVDICKKALKVANHNMELLQLTERATLKQSDWFSSLRREKFDVIISNPPYIGLETTLDTSTLYDPHKALFAGEDGFKAYTKILPEVKYFLKSNGKLYLEIGFKQKNQVELIAEQSGLAIIACYSDLAGIERVLCIKHSV